MQPLFAAYAAASDAAAQAIYGEPVRFLPRRQPGNFTPAGADPDRASFDFRALVTIDQGVQRTDGAQGGAFGVEIVGAEIRVNAALSAFAAPPRKADRLQALSRTGAPVFEIVRVAPDNSGRLVLHCARVDAP